MCSHLEILILHILHKNQTLIYTKCKVFTHSQFKGFDDSFGKSDQTKNLTDRSLNLFEAKKITKMLKKLFTILILTSLIGTISVNSSDALFFKHKKSKEAKQAAPQVVKNVNLVVIYASWCPGCKNIQPTLDQIEKEFGNIVNLVYLDVSTPKQAIASLQKAKELNIVDFYNVNKSKTSTVGIIIPKNGEVVTTFQNNNNFDDYKNAIQQAETKAKALENPPA